MKCGNSPKLICEFSLVKCPLTAKRHFLRVTHFPSQHVRVWRRYPTTLVTGSSRHVAPRRRTDVGWHDSASRVMTNNSPRATPFSDLRINRGRVASLPMLQQGYPSAVRRLRQAVDEMSVWPRDRQDAPTHFHGLEAVGLGSAAMDARHASSLHRDLY